MSIAELVPELRDSRVKLHAGEDWLQYRAPDRLRSKSARVAEPTTRTSRTAADPWTATDDLPVIFLRVDPQHEWVGGAENGAHHER
ncbi:hypothetical protein [Nocardiopsis rhodophaea]|uniref:hypothetical protein n=1 Tax=Nocardiopsis rhodophaea TaxID=280238 RepID=UPI0031DEF0BC